MTAEIIAIIGRDNVGAAIATRKDTIIPHSIEPPYFTTKAGSPRPSPTPRKARPAAMIDRHRQMRAIIRALHSFAEYRAIIQQMSRPATTDGQGFTFTKS